jgi:hypothetical protein
VPEYVVLPDVDTCSITVRAAAEMHECGMVSHWCGVWLPLQDRRTVWEEKCGLLQGTMMDVRGNKGSCVGFQENNVVGADNENLGDGAESVISLNDDILNSDAAAPVQDVGTISLSTFGNLGDGEEVDVVTYSENFTGPVRPGMPTHPDAVKFKKGSSQEQGDDKGICATAMGHHMTNLDKELQDEKVDESEGDELEDWEEDPVEALRRRGCHDEYEQAKAVSALLAHGDLTIFEEGVGVATATKYLFEYGQAMMQLLEVKVSGLGEERRRHEVAVVLAQERPYVVRGKTPSPSAREELMPYLLNLLKGILVRLHIQTNV